MPHEIITSPQRIAQLLRLDAERLQELEQVAKFYPLRVTDYYLGLARSNSPDDPILRQCLPNLDEINDASQGGADPDPLAEEAFSPVPRLVHRYPDRGLFMVNNCCATFCRHCLRKRHWSLAYPPPTEEELQAVCQYLRQHQEIREVLVSGGDPLMLPLSQLRHLLEALAEIPTLDILRLGSRIPVTAPDFLTEEMAAMLGNLQKPIWFATHFNHPWEITPQSAAAVARLVKNGIPVVNQAVLLKGVNDTSECLAELFTGLLKIKVKPYYLFHGDPVKGCMHFRTGLQTGLQIMDRLRGRISGLAIPAFAFDLPGGHGKIRLEAETRISHAPDIFRDYQGNEIQYL